jgi:hypothetical protein
LFGCLSYFIAYIGQIYKEQFKNFFFYEIGRQMELLASTGPRPHPLETNAAHSLVGSRQRRQHETGAALCSFFFNFKLKESEQTAMGTGFKFRGSEKKARNKCSLPVFI